MTLPIVSTEWANGATALQEQPTASHVDRGWDTDTGDTSGAPQKIELQYLNGWRKNVHTWLQYIVDRTQKIALIPAGTIVPVATNITGSYPIPATGIVTDGWMYCDGAVIPGGQVLSGNVPDLTGDTFVQGSLVAGGTGGLNTKTFSEAEMYSHSHAANTFATSLSGTFGSNTHNHGIGRDFKVPFNSDGNIKRWQIFTNGTSWTSTVKMGTSSTTGSSSVVKTSYLDCFGETEGPSANGSYLSGSSNVSGTSDSSGSGSSFDSRPRFISCQYLIKVI